MKKSILLAFGDILFHLSPQFSQTEVWRQQAGALAVISSDSGEKTTESGRLTASLTGRGRWLHLVLVPGEASK